MPETLRTRVAVFLDRDDTLIDNRELTRDTSCPGDLADPALVRLMPGVAQGLKAIAALGYAIVVISNQGVVARGGAPISRVEASNRRMSNLIRAAGGPKIDAVYACPFHPNGTSTAWMREHPWRKPLPGMFLAAAEDLGIDTTLSWLVGDAQRDADAAVAAGIDSRRAIIIGGARFPDFASAAKHIVAESGTTRR
ncbi:MAG: HAD-IIIA family hydrolase [Phycisphaeraceae bacterium]|nr:HAD-IIIA family hydrolase [Phycisphaeraceae bacterium]